MNHDKPFFSNASSVNMLKFMTKYYTIFSMVYAGVHLIEFG